LSVIVKLIKKQWTFRWRQNAERESLFWIWTGSEFQLR